MRKSWILLIAVIIIGGIRVHFTGEYKNAEAGLEILNNTDKIEGFMYRPPWASSGQLLFVSDSFKALVYTERFSEEDIKYYESGKQCILENPYFSLPEEARNPGQFSQKNYLLSRGVDYTIRPSPYKIKPSAKISLHNILHRPGSVIRSKIKSVLEQNLGLKNGGLALAVMTGETGSLDKQSKNNFRDSGLSHLMAVSGTHVMFVMIPINILNKRTELSFKKKKLLMTVPLGAFAFIADFSPSVIRAVFQNIGICIASVLNRPSDSISLLTVSAAFQILVNPYSVINTGFILSYLSVTSIVLISPKLMTCLGGYKRNNKSIKKITLISSQSLCAGIAVYVGILPVMAKLFGSISVSGLILTLFSSYFALGICISGYLLCILSIFPMFDRLSILFSGFIYSVCTLFDKTAEFGSKLPVPLGTIKTPDVPVLFIVIWYSILFIFLFNEKKWFKDIIGKIKTVLSRKRFTKYVILIIVITIIFFGLYASYKTNVLEVLVIDVGQGNSVLIKTHDFTGLMDTGDGKTDISDVLTSFGISKIDFLILSHGHSDHISGLNDFLDAFSPETVFSSYNNEKGLNDALRLCESKGLKSVKCKNLDTVELGDVTMVFMVCDSYFGYSSDEAVNNSSLCIMLKTIYGSIFIASDLETEGEEYLCKTGTLEQADILLVPHHGSKKGSNEILLCKIQPVCAIISVGKKNSYGHPSPDTVTRLSHYCDRIYRTDQSGGILIKIGRNNLFRKEKIEICPTL